MDCFSSFRTAFFWRGAGESGQFRVYSPLAAMRYAGFSDSIICRGLF